jgi:hypothetical protein
LYIQLLLDIIGGNNDVKKRKSKKPSKKSIWIMRLLDRLDDVVFNTPGKESSRLDRAVFSFIRGGPKRPRLKRTGNWFWDWLIRVCFCLSLCLDRLDTWLLYDGRGVRTSSGVRVRSRSERRIAELLDERRITYKYEHPLTLDGIKLKPDFFLTKVKTYIEFWGMIGNKRYVIIMRKKKRLYKKHNIKVISLYPNHMRNLKGNLAKRYEKVTGKKFPKPRRSSVSVF